MKPEFCAHEWLELAPKAMIFEGEQFVFMLEDREKKLCLPLRFPLASADLLGIPNLQSLWRKSLSTMTDVFLKEWGVRFQRCVFLQQNGDHHRVRLYYFKDDREAFLEENLEKVFGICLDSKLPFYATRDYVSRSQVGLHSSLTFSENILGNQQVTGNRQRYLM